jgi:hypothetical protein
LIRRLLNGQFSVCVAARAVEEGKSPRNRSEMILQEKASIIN